MIDYGKTAQFMAAQGLAWNTPGPQPKKQAAMPAVWDPTSTGHEWDRAMMRIGFDASVCDEARWVYSHAPTEDRMGVTLIVYVEDGRWLLDFCLDTVATEDDATWDMETAAPDNCRTPLEVAQWAKDHVRRLLTNALAGLP